MTTAYRFMFLAPGLMMLLLSMLLSMPLSGCGDSGTNGSASGDKASESTSTITNGSDGASSDSAAGSVNGNTGEVSSSFTPLDPAKLGTVERDVTYSNAGGVDLKMDVYYPNSATGPLPVVMYVHGGGWTRGDKQDGAGARAIPDLQDAGFLVVSINYRLAPEYIFPAQIEDVKCAVRYLRANAGEYSLDPERIGA